MRLIDIQSTADFFGVSRATISRMIEAGTLPAVKIRAGRRKAIFRIPDHAVRKFLNLKPSEPLESAIIAKPKKRTVPDGENGETI